MRDAPRSRSSCIERPQNCGRPWGCSPSLMTMAARRTCPATLVQHGEIHDMVEGSSSRGEWCQQCGQVGGTLQRIGETRHGKIPRSDMGAQTTCNWFRSRQYECLSCRARRNVSCCNAANERSLHLITTGRNESNEVGGGHDVTRLQVPLGSPHPFGRLSRWRYAIQLLQHDRYHRGDRQSW